MLAAFRQFPSARSTRVMTMPDGSTAAFVSFNLPEDADGAVTLASSRPLFGAGTVTAAEFLYFQPSQQKAGPAGAAAAPAPPPPGPPSRYGGAYHDAGPARGSPPPPYGYAHAALCRPRGAAAAHQCATFSGGVAIAQGRVRGRRGAAAAGQPEPVCGQPGGPSRRLAHCAVLARGGGRSLTRPTRSVPPFERRATDDGDARGALPVLFALRPHRGDRHQAVQRPRRAYASPEPARAPARARPASGAVLTGRRRCAVVHRAVDLHRRRARHCVRVCQVPRRPGRDGRDARDGRPVHRPQALVRAGLCRGGDCVGAQERR